MSIPSKPAFKEKYGNFIGGKFVPPVKGEYFENISPIDGKAFTLAARSGKEDIELALDAAHAAFATWGNHQQPTGHRYSTKLLMLSKPILNTWQ